MDITTIIISKFADFLSKRKNSEDIELLKFELKKELEKYKVNTAVFAKVQEEKYELITDGITVIYDTKKLIEKALEEAQKNVVVNLEHNLTELSQLVGRFRTLYRDKYLILENLGLLKLVHDTTKEMLIVNSSMELFIRKFEKDGRILRSTPPSYFKEYIGRLEESYSNFQREEELYRNKFKLIMADLLQ